MDGFRLWEGQKSRVFFYLFKLECFPFYEHLHLSLSQSPLLLIFDICIYKVNLIYAKMSSHISLHIYIYIYNFFPLIFSWRQKPLYRLIHTRRIPPNQCVQHADDINSKYYHLKRRTKQNMNKYQKILTTRLYSTMFTEKSDHTGQLSINELQSRKGR